MCNVPPKFYQVCRLCLTLVGDGDAVKLSIFDAPVAARPLQQQQSQLQKAQLQINRINNNGGGVSSGVIISNSRPSLSSRKSEKVDNNVADNNNHHHQQQQQQMVDNDDDYDDDEEDDDQRLELLQRIYTFLEIKVSFWPLLF